MDTKKSIAEKPKIFIVFLKPNIVKKRGKLKKGLNENI